MSPFTTNNYYNTKFGQIIQVYIRNLDTDILLIHSFHNNNCIIIINSSSAATIDQLCNTLNVRIYVTISLNLVDVLYFFGIIDRWQK